MSKNHCVVFPYQGDFLSLKYWLYFGELAAPCTCILTMSLIGRTHLETNIWVRCSQTILDPNEGFFLSHYGFSKG